MIGEINPLLLGGLIITGALLGYFIRPLIALQKKKSLEKKIQEDIDKANNEAKDIILKAKDKASTILSEIQEEEKERKRDLKKMEERLLKREDNLDEERKKIESRSEEYRSKYSELQQKEEEIKETADKVMSELENISGLTKEEAQERLIKEIEEKEREGLAEKIASIDREKRDEIEKKGLEVITSAIQRYARDYISDITTTTVSLPDDELKGKIIGREGRNIRTFERLTGVEVVVDEAPEAVVLSSFDPYRRELARLAMEKLIKDGRIQPAKIEEKVAEATEELEEEVMKVGEEAAYEAGVMDLPKEIIKIIGKLKYRTSYGQNVLDHSVEMAHIAGMISAELGLDVEVTKKAALLHDIGKAIDHDVEGTHVELGRKLLKKYDIEEPVIRAMEAHHEEYPFSTPESYIIAAADAISAARPGARRDTLEKYIDRVEKIEKIASDFEGVEKAYAISAGREVRVFAVPEKLDDYGALQLARKIADKIKNEVQFPGEVKVTVIREVRAVEYAK